MATTTARASWADFSSWADRSSPSRPVYLPAPSALHPGFSDDASAMTPAPMSDSPTEADPSIPWDDLRRRAVEVAARAYAPYSGFRVGAAGYTEDGQVVAACNVENASYGLTLCAECGLVSAVHAAGAGRLVAVVVVTDDGSPCTPCGRCRQLLLEQGGPDLLVDGDGTPRRMADLLPGGFDRTRLEDR